MGLVRTRGEVRVLLVVARTHRGHMARLLGSVIALSLLSVHRHHGLRRRSLLGALVHHHGCTTTWTRVPAMCLHWRNMLRIDMARARRKHLHGLVAFSFLLLSSVSASSSPWVAAGGGGDALSFPSLPPCKRPSPAPNPCLSDTQHRSSGSKHHHSTRSPSVLCFRCFSCCCYSYFSSLGISRPVNLASLSVVRFGAFFSFLFLHSPFHFVSASCSCLSALCYDLHIRALLFFVCEPNKLTSGAVRPGKGGSVEKLTAEKKKKVISRTPPGPHEWEKGRRDHRFQPCAVPDTVRQCVRLPSALGRGKWIANAIALGPEVCMYGGCASVMYVRLSLPFLCLTLKFF